jgi:elongation factor G
MAGEIADGGTITAPDGTAERIAGINALQGETQTRCDKGVAGDVVCLGRLEKPVRGDIVAIDGPAAKAALLHAAHKPVYSMAIETQDRQDDVKLTAAMAKLIDEDPSLSFGPDPATREFRLAGQGEIHLRVALDRLARKYGIKVDARRPRTAYRESIRGQTTQRGRLKKQSGGHGQFADVLVEVRARQRGEGFAFAQKIHGGVVPRQYFSAVEAGARDALEKGPLGFPVVDIETVLVDGSHHTVDSSEMAFRTAGRIAVQEALPHCKPVLLEPVHSVTIHTPTDAVARITGLVPTHRGHIHNLEPRQGWPGWDSVKAMVPEDELHELILEIRSATQGLGELESELDHMAEVTGPTASKVVEAHAAHAGK